MEHEYCEKVIDLSARVNLLEEWQEKQNGSIQRIETKVDKMYNAIIVAGLAFIANLIFMLLGVIRSTTPG